MLATLSWLAIGVAIALAVRELTPDRQFLGTPRAAALGACGGLLGGLAGNALMGPGDLSGNRGLTACIAAAVGAWVVPWMYLAYGIRWEGRGRPRRSPWPRLRHGAEPQHLILCAPDVSVAPTLTRTPPTPRAGNVADPHPLTVLIVDDQHGTADTTAAVLVAHGFSAQVAYGGPEALAAIATQLPDAILLDGGMRRADDWELARQIRDVAADRRPLLIAVTGYGTDTSLQMSDDARVDLHLTEPIDPAVLVGMLRRFERTLGRSPG